MGAPRYLEKFTNVADSIVVTFPLLEYEYQSSVETRTPMLTGVGRNGGYDSLGDAATLKDAPEDVVRGILDGDSPALFDTAADALMADVYRIGRGKLYTLGADGTRRWEYGRATRLPRMEIAVGRDRYSPIICGFRREQAQWRSTTLTTVNQTITALAQTWTVNNPGNIPARLLVMRLRSNSAAGFTNPKITNLTNGYVFESARDAGSTSDELKLDTELALAQRSVDDGGSYTDDIAQLVFATQPPLSFVLEPGDNTLRYNGSGTPNLDIVITFYAPFEG